MKQRHAVLLVELDCSLIGGGGVGGEVSNAAALQVVSGRGEQPGGDAVVPVVLRDHETRYGANPLVLAETGLLPDGDGSIADNLVTVKAMMVALSPDSRDSRKRPEISSSCRSSVSKKAL